MDVATVLDKAAWRTVPDRVAWLYKRAAAVADGVKPILTQIRDSDDGSALFEAWYDADSDTLYINAGDWGPVDDWRKQLEPLVSRVDIADEAGPGAPDDGGDWVKVAQKTPSKALEWFGQPHRMAQTAMGGPNPLSSMIVSGLLGGGLGYGTGWLLERLFPERYVRRGRTPKTLAALGALGAAALPAWRASAAVRNEGPSGLIRRDAPIELPGLPWSKSSADFSRFDAEAEELYELIGPLDEKFATSAIKWAQDVHGGRAGSFLVESVPVDAFNNTVWNDTRPTAASRNPYGTKNPFGTNEQPLLPGPTPTEAALVTGAVEGARAQTGKSLLSPLDIAKGVAGAGIGLASAKAVGGLAGAFFGVQPKARKRLEDIGALGGLLTPILRGVLN